MAWIAAIISGIAGGSAASNQQKAAKKANRQSGILDSQGYANALNSLKDYQGIGKEGALSLAQLMGLKGYRTPEEQALTEHLMSKPGAPGKADWKDKADWFTKAITGHPAYESDQPTGKAYGSATGFTGAAGFKDMSDSSRYAGAVNLSGLGGLTDLAFRAGARGKKKAAARAAAANATADANHRNSLAAWEAKKSELEQKANASLVNYDPTAALRNTPGYQFRYDTGLNTVMNQQTGRQLSGRAAKELERYGQGFASNEFGNEFNRRLALATGGQSAATTAGNWSIGQGGNAANLALQSGNIDSQYYNDLNNVVQQGLGNYLTYRNRNQRRTPYSSSYQNYPQGNPDIAETYMYPE